MALGPAQNAPGIREGCSRRFKERIGVMLKDPVFGMVDCWGCGNPTVKGGPFTAGCPGCQPGLPHCEKASDYDTQELLHPELKELRLMDEAILARV